MKALSAAMPASATATPKCAITMPHVGSGVRRRLRFHSGARLATATTPATVMPSSGSTPTSPPNNTSPNSTTAPAKMATGSRVHNFLPSSLRQLSSGPATMTRQRISASGPATLL